MDNTHFSRKCEILSQLREWDLKGTWDEFFRMYDVGVPLAVLITDECAIPTEKGREYVEEAWQELCRILNVDHYGRYESLIEMTEFASGE